MSPMDYSQEEVDSVARSLLETAAPGKQQSRKRKAPRPAPPDSFGALLRGARRRKGWKQPKMARTLGYTESYYQSIESGRTPPTLNFRAAVYAWALGEGFEHLFDPVRAVAAPAQEVEQHAATAEACDGVAPGVVAAALLSHSEQLRRRCAALQDRYREQSAELAELFRRSEAAVERSRLVYAALRP